MPCSAQSASATQRASGYVSLAGIAFAMPTTIIKRMCLDFCSARVFFFFLVANTADDVASGAGVPSTEALQALETATAVSSAAAKKPASLLASAKTKSTAMPKTPAAAPWSRGRPGPRPARRARAHNTPAPHPPAPPPGSPFLQTAPSSPSLTRSAISGRPRRSWGRATRDTRSRALAASSRGSSSAWCAWGPACPSGRTKRAATARFWPGR